MKRAKRVSAYIAVVLAANCVWLTAARADLSSEMESWFGSSSYSNGASAGAYQSQLGGYYTGGNVSVRVPTKTVGVFGSFQGMSAQGGCGGIDLDLGGFNLVNKDQIVQQLRAIGQNAKALAFSMAIKYVSSLLGSTMDTVKEWADKLNSMQMDSCSAAANLMQMAGDALTAGEEKNVGVCIQIQASKNNLSYDEARRRCTSGGAKLSTLDAEGNKRTFTTGNLAWFAMMQVPWLKTDLDLAEVLMNITGTVIMKTDGAGNNAVRKPISIAPLGLDGNLGMEALLSAMIYGADSKEGFKGKVKIIRCATKASDELGCAELANDGARVDFDMSTLPSIKDKLKARIASIYSKVHDREAELTEQDKALIESVRAPLYRYILVSATAFNYNDANRDAMFNSYIDGLSKEIVANNLQSLITEVSYHMDMDKLNSRLDGEKDGYLTSLKSVMAYLGKVKLEAKQEADYALEMQIRAQQYERIITSRLSMGTMAATQFR